MNWKFFKMSGAGNDFVAINNMERRFPADPERRADWVRRLCERRLGVGADGVLLIEPSAVADFRMRYYNADGGEAETCGNGSRCVARFAHLEGVVGATARFETQAGLYRAEIFPDSVRVSMSDALGLQMDAALPPDSLDRALLGTAPLLRERGVVDFVNTGVPHVVVLVDDLEGTPVFELGRALRRHPRFSPAGTNANFIRLLGENHLGVRTYERGVEDETLACGTGSIASAIVAERRGLVRPPVRLTTRGGMDLSIGFEPSESGAREVTLQGEARVVFSGEIEVGE
jgi:diaminopimelate epimerase